MFITLEWPHLWSHSWVCVDGWTLLLCFQMLWLGVWKIGGQYPHKPLNLHFVGLVFYDTANNYVYKEHPIKDTNINILWLQTIFSPAQLHYRRQTHDFIIYILSVELEYTPCKVLGRKSTADDCFIAACSLVFSGRLKSSSALQIPVVAFVP